MKPNQPHNRRHRQGPEKPPDSAGNRRINQNETFKAPSVRSRTSVGREVFGRWCLIIGILVLAMSGESRAQWGRTPEDYIRLPLASPPNYSSTICSDLNGGCWVAGDPVGLCHIDRLGNITWGDTALWFRETSFRAKLVPVDTASVIVAMLRVVRDTTKVYLNRINTDKELLWGEDGIAMENNHSPQGVMDAIPGPVPNTFLIHWASPYRRLRLINPDGETLWNANSLRLPAWSENAKVLTTSDNCIILAHSVEPYPRQNPLVEVIKMNAEGEELWRRRYAIISELQPTLRGWELSDVESDRDGGIILSTKYGQWNSINDSLRYFSLGIMRISGDGDSIWTHKVYERQVEPIDRVWREIINPLEQCYFILNYTGLGHYFAAWMDNLRHSDDDPFKVISFNDDFELQWDEPLDVIISPAGYGKLEAVDSDTSVIYVWRDRDQDRENINEQWGQRIALNGERLWDDRGNVIISRTPSKQSATTDGNGGVITTVDFNFPALHMMNRNGEIGVVLDPVGVNNDRGFLRNKDVTPQLNVYPNPGNSYIRVELSPVYPNDAFSYIIYDLLGRSVTRGIINGFPYLVKDMDRFSSGDYILRLESPRMTVAKRFSLVK